MHICMHECMYVYFIMHVCMYIFMCMISTIYKKKKKKMSGLNHFKLDVRLVLYDPDRWQLFGYARP